MSNNENTKEQYLTENISDDTWANSDTKDSLINFISEMRFSNNAWKYALILTAFITLSLAGVKELVQLNYIQLNGWLYHVLVGICTCLVVLVFIRGFNFSWKWNCIRDRIHARKTAPFTNNRIEQLLKNFCILIVILPLIWIVHIVWMNLDLPWYISSLLFPYLLFIQSLYFFKAFQSMRYLKENVGFFLHMLQDRLVMKEIDKENDVLLSVERPIKPYNEN